MYVDPNGKQVVNPASSGGGTTFIYYVGNDNFDAFGLLGHTGLGYSGKYDKNSTTLYAPLSGNSAHRESRIRNIDGERMNGVSENNVIKSYLDGGEIVQRVHFNLDNEKSEKIVGEIEMSIINPSHNKESICTSQCKGRLKGAGLSSETIDQMIPYSLPEEQSPKEILKSGSKSYDRFYKKDDKYYQETNRHSNGKWNKTTNEISL